MEKKLPLSSFGSERIVPVTGARVREGVVASHEQKLKKKQIKTSKARPPEYENSRRNICTGAHIYFAYYRSMQ